MSISSWNMLPTETFLTFRMSPFSTKPQKPRPRSFFSAAAM